MIKSKKQMFIVIISFILILVLGTVTYAFFNYTRTGSANTISVGRISFVTRQTSTINLTNVFPIDRNDIDTDTDNVDEVVIEIEGDTDYVDGIEYLVSSVDANIYSSLGTLIPISLDIDVSSGLGTENDNYYTVRENKNASIYKVLAKDTLVGDQMLLVGYIKKNTTNGTIEGIDGSITIKAFFDKDKILISDTYDGTESDNMGTTNTKAEGKTVLTTTEWNNIRTNGVSFKVKVEANEGIWVNGSLNDIMEKDTVMDNINSTHVNNVNPGVDFKESSSDTNGKGIYTRFGTENDTYPIMYYRGNIDNNNVLFGNYCWKAMRTTETGGVKLLYNGEYGNIYEKEIVDLSIIDTTYIDPNVATINYVDNSITISTIEETAYVELIVPENDYLIELTGSYGEASYFYFDLGAASELIYSENAHGIIYQRLFTHVNQNGGIYIDLDQEGVVTPATIIVKLYTLGDSLGVGCANDQMNPAIAVNNVKLSAYSTNSSKNRVGYTGLSFDDFIATTSTSGKIFGNTFIYENGVYTLVNTRIGLDESHHYTCFSNDASATCSTIRYYSHNQNYTSLSNGEGIDEFVEKINENGLDSDIKTFIDTWYQTNMLSYTTKLEDAVYCNDRVISSLGSYNYQNGLLDDYFGGIKYSIVNRLANGQPSLNCSNKKDSLTVNNISGNKLLDYPIALITVDELMLAGGSKNDTTAFVNSANSFYTMTPSMVSANGSVLYNSFDHSFSEIGSSVRIGARPAITLKYGTNVIKGDGTQFNPYIIE